MKKSMITLVAAATLFAAVAPAFANQYDDASRAAVANRDQAVRNVNKIDRPAVMESETAKLKTFLTNEKTRIEKIRADWKKAAQNSAKYSYNFDKEKAAEMSRIDAAIAAKQGEINAAQATKEAALAHYNEKVATHGEGVAKLSFGSDLETAKAADAQIKAANEALKKLEADKAKLPTLTAGKEVAENYNEDAHAQLKQIDEALDYIRQQIRAANAKEILPVETVSTPEVKPEAKKEAGNKETGNKEVKPEAKKEAKDVKAAKTAKGDKKLPKTSAVK